VLHILEAVCLPDLEDIRVPKSHAGESGLRRDLHARPEVMQAALIAERIRSNRERPEGSDNFKWLCHGAVRIKWYSAWYIRDGAAPNWESTRNLRSVRVLWSVAGWYTVRRRPRTTLRH
jgi:hypothetical protein